jgi:hypothetical protein
METLITGSLTWNTSSDPPGWRLTIDGGETLRHFGVGIAQDASQQELQTLLADAFHDYLGVIPARIDLLTPVHEGHGETAYQFCVGYDSLTRLL